MTQDRIEKLEERIEQIIKDNKCEDREIQEALLAVARNHIWKQGLFARVQFWANLIGHLGTIGGLFFAATYLLGWEWVRR